MGHRPRSGAAVGFFLTRHTSGVQVRLRQQAYNGVMAPGRRVSNLLLALVLALLLSVSAAQVVQNAHPKPGVPYPHDKPVASATTRAR